ncbi:MAG: DNA mismatch repair protein MutS [Nitrospirae bacterium]|nr:DNA mismatch repair protein MutS [Nitrospirota bacterium]
MSELTPLMKQYQDIKKKYADAILLFRLGDFYEMFGEDARTASKVLQIALTTREKGKEEPMPMCGVPYFAADSYITKLIKAGHKVAVCEQVEDPKDAKGIVQREVVRVITPGTHTPESPKENNYIMSFMPEAKKHCIALVDVSTGEFIIYETLKPIEDEIARVEPKEIIYPESLKDNLHYSETLKEHFSTPIEDWRFDYEEAYRCLLRYFKVASLEGYGCEGMTGCISSAGALLSYIEEIEKVSSNLKRISLRSESSTMFLDASTQRNLELLRNLKGEKAEGSLLWALDETLTPMGGRFLRAALLNPLTDVRLIRKRLNAVRHLVEDYSLAETLRNSLRKVQDIERLERKVSMSTANPRDLIALKTSISHLPHIKKATLSSADDYLRELSEGISELPEVIDLIQKGIVEHPPLGLKEGGIIKDGFSKEVDELRAASRSGKNYIASLEAEERQKTGISSLKVGYNRIFGYYIEVTNANLEQVPERYIRKQTLVSGERFITPEVKEFESKVIGAEEKLKALEYHVFGEILESIREHSERILSSARSLSIVDFLLSLAVVAKRHNYVMPHVDEGTGIKILEGRHPVLERLPTKERFISNSVYLDSKTQRLLIITGPNMAGKSTYIRQIALIALMSQIGSFVPADEADIGVVDRVFTRIGASDFLIKGQSTFMVEMIETANILNNATERSLILLDEIGRGTSTFDGISIAWATAEYIVRHIMARTLFATHYNELTELPLSVDAVKNLNVAVKEWGEEIIFLRKIEEGPADKSYGIHVARLAGMPEEIVHRAKDVLMSLEQETLATTGMPRLQRGKGKAQGQLNLFIGAQDVLVLDLKNMDIEGILPEDAVRKLKELKEKAGLIP